MKPEYLKNLLLSEIDSVSQRADEFSKEEKAPPDVEYLIGHELFPVRSGRTDPCKVTPQSVISFLCRAA